MGVQKFKCWDVNTKGHRYLGSVGNVEGKKEFILEKYQDSGVVIYCIARASAAYRAYTNTVGGLSAHENYP